MQLGPEMSEAQRINAKMMRFMPFMFLVFLYFFSSALVLYWTVQNIMTILQTLLTKNVTLPNLTEKDEKGRDKSFDRKSVREVQDIEYEEESDDEERKLRNLLGLKAKGKIDLKLLESRYKERMNNYTSKRLENMSEQKRTSAEEKRDKITEAYETLRKMDNKQS